MIRRLSLLVGGSLAVWIVAVLPARYLWGDPVVVYSGVAVLLCLVPTSITLVWATRTLRASPQQLLIMVLGGTGVRVFAVLAGAIALKGLVPFFRDSDSFLIWVLVFYLVTLGFELALVLTGLPEISGDPPV